MWGGEFFTARSSARWLAQPMWQPLQRLAERLCPGWLRPVTGFGAMDPGRSRAVLGLGRGTNTAERYKTLLRINHPDRGGSPYIAGKINEARHYRDEYDSWL